MEEVSPSCPTEHGLLRLGPKYPLSAKPDRPTFLRLKKVDATSLCPDRFSGTPIQFADLTVTKLGGS